jgi:hypothetical protein
MKASDYFLCIPEAQMMVQEIELTEDQIDESDELFVDFE